MIGWFTLLLALARADVLTEQVGSATWYCDCLAGRKTASGEPYDPTLLTAAHRTLPFGTVVDVRRESTGKTVRVRVNDRGPFSSPDRIIDLSRAAAEQIDMIKAGVVDVTVTVVSPEPPVL